MKSVVERMFFILCVFYCNLLFIQDNITDKKTDKTLTRKKAIEMQELIRDHFNKFMTKLEVVAKKLKIQNHGKNNVRNCRLYRRKRRI